VLISGEKRLEGGRENLIWFRKLLRSNPSVNQTTHQGYKNYTKGFL